VFGNQLEELYEIIQNGFKQPEDYRVSKVILIEKKHELLNLLIILIQIECWLRRSDSV
jgi:hypothetical protein